MYKINNSILTIFVFFILLVQVNLNAQIRSFGTLPLINAGEIKGDPDENLNHTEDFKQILGIYNKLVEARGDFRHPVPQLFLKDVEGRVASIEYNSNQITIEKKAYNVCKKHGDAAVAFLLGHELTHYYEKHAWRDGFARTNADLAVGKSLISVNDDITNETEADYLGGFLAYTAGLGMFNKGGEIIGDLYKEYGMGENVPGYPSKTDRIELGRRSAKRLEALVDAFDMANLLAAVSKDNLAFNYYEYILSQYQSREIYNNLGTIAVENAISFFNKDSLKFKYVSELDIDFGGSKDASLSVIQQINDAFNQAILFFNAATSLDPNYAPAYLNKANVYALKKDFAKAKFYLEEEAKPIANKNPIKYAKTILDIAVLEGIISAVTGNDAVAREKFTQAKDKGSKLAKANLDILNGVEIDTTRTIFDFSSDTIGKQSLKSFFKKPKIDDKKVLAIKPTQTFFQFVPDSSKSKIFLNQDNTNKQRTAFLMTADNYKGKTMTGIKIGDTDEKVIQVHGKPKTIVETTRGQMHVYDSIVFIIDKNVVKKWILYSTNKFI